MRPSVHSGVSWQHIAAAVPGYVPADGGRRGDLHGGHPERIQPPAHGTPQVRPQGRPQRLRRGGLKY